MDSTKRKTAPEGRPSNNSNNTKQKTQKQVVLEELMAHRDDGVTSWDFIEKYHITRAASYICDFKKQGHDIRSVSVTMDGGGWYSRYFYVGGPND